MCGYTPDIESLLIPPLFGTVIWLDSDHPHLQMLLLLILILFIINICQQIMNQSYVLPISHSLYPMNVSDIGGEDEQG